VLEAPRGFVGHAELVLELQRRDGVLVLGNQVQGQEPDRHRQLALAERGARGQRSPMPLIPALQHAARLDPGLGHGTAPLPADKPARPVPPEHRLAALRLAAVGGEELGHAQPLL